jgi:uncharacterized delta-60 repeat protein
MWTARRIVVALVTGLFLVSISSQLTWAAPKSGGLDPTFGVRGKVLTDFSGSGSNDFARALAIQSDGKIVAAGNSNVHPDSDPPDSDFALARYTSRGRIDRRFGANGKILTNFRSLGGAQAGAHALAIQSDGKIVAAGFSETSGSLSDFALARYNPDGTLDATFNATGKVLTDFGGSGSLDVANAMVIQSDGKIVAAGHSIAFGGALVVFDFALARYNPDGTLDARFNSTGKVLTDFSGSGSIDFARAMVIQSDGKIVAAGDSDASGTADFALARYLP